MFFYQMVHVSCELLFFDEKNWVEINSRLINQLPVHTIRQMTAISDKKDVVSDIYKIHTRDVYLAEHLVFLNHATF